MNSFCGSWQVGIFSVVLCFSYPIRARANLVKQRQIGLILGIFLKPTTQEVFFQEFKVAYSSLALRVPLYVSSVGGG